MSRQPRQTALTIVRSPFPPFLSVNMRINIVVFPKQYVSNPTLYTRVYILILEIAMLLIVRRCNNRMFALHFHQTASCFYTAQ